MLRFHSTRFRPRLLRRTLSSASGQVKQTCVDAAPLGVASNLRQAPGRVPATIWDRKREKLHLVQGHPLCTLRETIEGYFEQRFPGEFHFSRNLDPVVSVEACFDSLLVPADHPSRAPSDTYYVDDEHVLRAHMTAHDTALLRANHRAFISCGDVYRRDTVDRTHYPVFHQVDGVRLFESGMGSGVVISNLRDSLEGLAETLFGSSVDIRWVSGEFPFTNPSLELEVLWGGEWLEVLGCGELRRGVLEHGGIRDPECRGWAFGLGLERLAMVLFEIPDIRLFWSKDPRFLLQFKGGDLKTRFQPFSSFPPVCKDVSFWFDDNFERQPLGFHENDIHECARDIGGDLIERVERIDVFEREGRISHCYRITFRSMEKNLTHLEINQLYHELRSVIASRLPVTLR